MIVLKDKLAQEKMKCAGKLLCTVFNELEGRLLPGISTLELDTFIEDSLLKKKLVSQSKGYLGYCHTSCISVNDEVVHGIPHERMVLKVGDLVKVDICAAHNGYCADMARCFFVGGSSGVVAKKLVDVANEALDRGIECAVPGGHLGDISSAIQSTVERGGFAVVRAFAGHGIGRRMHEEPEILNYGRARQGPVLKAGMSFALEPMITAGHHEVYTMPDGWTAKTVDGSLAAHVEDTVIITDNGPYIVTRMA